jgi:hypothetical protein
MEGDAKPPRLPPYVGRVLLWLSMLWSFQAVVYFGNKLAHVMVVDDLTIHLEIGAAMIVLAAVLAAIPDLI